MQHLRSTWKAQTQSYYLDNLILTQTKVLKTFAESGEKVVVPSKVLPQLQLL